MNDEHRDLELVRQLKSAVPPCDAELQTDLWPRMLCRMSDTSLNFGWFEGILVALLAITFVVYPDLLPAMLYHL